MTAPAKPTSELMKEIGDRSLGLGRRINSVRGVLEANKSSMFAALPRHITPDRLIRVALSCIRHTPKLLDCSQESLFAAITEAATLGLEPNGMLGHAYLIPYGEECVLVPGYKGLIDLCRRTGTISTLTAEVVHQGDAWSYQLGDDPFIRHVPNDDDPKRHDKPITHVYVVVRLRDGGVQRKVWSAEKVNHHMRTYSQAWKRAEKGKKDSPWHTNWAEMAKKTVIRDLINRGEIPVSVEIQSLAAREEYIEAHERRLDAIPAMSFDDLDRKLTSEESHQPSTDGEGSQETEPDDFSIPFRDLKGVREVEEKLLAFQNDPEISEHDFECLKVAADNRIAEIKATRGEAGNKGQKSLV